MDKNYSSIYNIKDFVSKEIAPKYFNMDRVNDLNVGLLGYTTELVTSLTEDNFNTVTMYMNEMFPNLAVLPESIYNYGALFQTDGSFATASEMDLLLLIDEKDIVNNATRVNDTLYEFILDSDMIIDVEGLQFMPDYNIKINYKRQNNDIIFTAQYVYQRYGAEYKNPISVINNPYIRTKRIMYSNTKYLILMIKAHKINRFSINETVLSNDVINAPTYTIEFDNQLASFEVFYKESGSSTPIQLVKRLNGSAPIQTPFCYYKIKDDNKLEITFTTRDLFFKPAFNSELIIDYSITDGEDGNFPMYTGNDITVIPSSETYAYNNGLILFAIPQSASHSGKNKLTTEQLKTVVNEKFSTVGSYTIENDLQLYFSNFKNNLDTDILFIKKRDDIFERLFTAFSIFKATNGNIYHTNTTAMKLKPGTIETGGDFDIELGQSDIMIMKPGHVFKYCNNILDCVESHNSYMMGKDNNNILISELGTMRTVASSTQSVDSFSDLPTTGDENVIYSIKGTNLVYIWNSVNQTYEMPQEFLYTNPFLIYFTKSPAAVGYYLNTINQNYIVDYKYVNPESIVQFICNSVTISRNAIRGDNSYRVTVMVTPTTELDNPIVIEGIDDDGNDTITKTDSLKLRLAIEDSGNEVCYTDMVLESWDIQDQLYTFVCDIETNDYINLNGRFNVTNMKNPGNGADINEQPIPMTDCVVNVYTNYKYLNRDNYVITNIYSTESYPVTFIQPVQMIRSTAVYSHNGDGEIKPLETGMEGETYIMEGGTYTVDIKSVPLVRASTLMDETLAMEFYSALTNQFNYVSDVLDKVTNNYSVDMKFYNTYGHSKNFYVGDNGDILLDRVNISLHIKVKPIFGIIEEDFIRDLRLYIKDYIENINDNGTNSIYISNLIQSLENDFPDLSYMKFVGINSYDSTVQVIDNKTVDLNTLTKDDRISYVPEYLTISLEDIRIDII